MAVLITGFATLKVKTAKNQASLCCFSSRDHLFSAREEMCSTSLPQRWDHLLLISSLWQRSSLWHRDDLCQQEMQQTAHLWQRSSLCYEALVCYFKTFFVCISFFSVLFCGKKHCYYNLFLHEQRAEKRDNSRDHLCVLFLMAKLLKQPVLFNAKLNRDNLCQRNYLVRHKIGRLHHLCCTSRDHLCCRDLQQEMIILCCWI